MVAVSTKVDLVKIIVTSTGTGPFVLGAALPGFRGVEALVNGAQYSYSVQQVGNYEFGTGVFLADPGVLNREVQGSSYGGQLVPFSSNAVVTFTLLAADFVGIPGEPGPEGSPGPSAPLFDPLLVQRLLLGDPSNPLSGGTDQSNVTTVFAYQFTENDNITHVRVRGGSIGGNLWVASYSANGSIYDISNPLTISANTDYFRELSDLVDIPQDGWAGYTTGSLGVVTYAEGEAFNNGYFSSDDVNSFDPEGTVYTNAQLHIGLYTTRLVIDAEGIEEMSRNVSDLLSLTSREDIYVNRQNTPVSGTPNGNNTIIFAHPVVTGNQAVSLEVYSPSSGGITIRRYALEGTNLVRQDPPLKTVAVTGGHLNTIALDFVSEPGYYAIDSDDGTICTTATSTDNQGFYSGARNAATISISGGASTGSRIEVRLKVNAIVRKQIIPFLVAGPSATGVDTVLQEWDQNNTLRASVGLQNTDRNDPQAGYFRAYGGTVNSSSHFDLSTYQYGGAIYGFGDFGHFFEYQLAATDLTLKPWLSVRHRVGGAVGANIGTGIMSRNSADTVGFGVNFQTDSDPHLWLEDSADTPATLGIYHPKSTGAIVQKIGGVEIGRTVAGGFQVAARAAAPAPTTDSFILWQKEAGGVDDGRVFATVNSGGSTSTTDLFDKGVVGVTATAPIVSTGGANPVISVTVAALTKTDDTNVTLTLGGTPTTALLAAVSFTLGWSGTLSVARGGTNISSYTAGDLVYASGTTTLSKLAAAATGNVLLSGTTPSWGKVGLTTHVTGVLPLANLPIGVSGAAIPQLNGATVTWAAGANYGSDVTISGTITTNGASSGFNVTARDSSANFILFANSNTFNFYTGGGVKGSLTNAGNFAVIGELQGASLRINAAPTVSVATPSTHKLAVNLNGTTYYLLLSNV